MTVAQGQIQEGENPERLWERSLRAQHGDICETGGCPAGSRCQRDRLVALLLLLRPQPEKEPARLEMLWRSWEAARSSRPSFGRKRRSRLGRAARLSLSSGSGQLAFPPRSPPLAAPESKGVTPSLRPACLPLGLLPELPCLQLVVRFLGGGRGQPQLQASRRLSGVSIGAHRAVPASGQAPRMSGACEAANAGRS